MEAEKRITARIKAYESRIAKVEAGDETAVKSAMMALTENFPVSNPDSSGPCPECGEYTEFFSEFSEGKWTYGGLCGHFHTR